jgi:CrcB protein
MSWLLVALGGALGATARYGVAWLVPRASSSAFPWATLLVNVIGCAVAGALGAVLMARAPTDTTNLRAFLGVGVLGGFTTFSAFGIDTFTLARDGSPGLALINVAANLTLSLAAVALGWSAMRATLT